MKKTLLLVPALLLATVAGAAAAQDHAAHAHAGHSGHPAKAAADDAFARLDTDKDGKLGAAELSGHPLQAHLSMVDADKDGKLDQREFAAGLKML